MPSIHYDIAHLLGALVLLLSFALLYQRRLCADRDVRVDPPHWRLPPHVAGPIQDAPHLYITAVLALSMKAIIIPVALHGIIVREHRAHRRYRAWCRPDHDRRRQSGHSVDPAGVAGDRRCHGTDAGGSALALSVVLLGLQ